jgi:hypothetical protein
LGSGDEVDRLGGNNRCSMLFSSSSSAPGKEKAEPIHQPKEGWNTAVVNIRGKVVTNGDKLLVKTFGTNNIHHLLKLVGLKNNDYQPVYPSTVTIEKKYT